MVSSGSPEEMGFGDSWESHPEPHPDSPEVPPPKRQRIHELILKDPISQLNAPPPLLFKAEDTVAEAAAEMRKRRYGSVLIVKDEGLLAGIFTERDLLRRCFGGGKPLAEITLGSVMTSRPNALTQKHTLAHALNAMAVGGYRHIPIVEKGCPVGFVSIRGILLYIAQSSLEEN